MAFFRAAGLMVRRIRPPSVLGIALALAALACRSRPGPAPPVRIEIRTALGAITAELDPGRAPATVANFLHYLDAGLFDGGRFHRAVTPENQPRDAVRIEVVQGGPSPARAVQGFPPIALERTSATGLRHLDGTLSMARSDPDTATSDFFVCIGDQPALDFGGPRNPDGQGFAAFGRVVAGMDVVRASQATPTRGQQIDPPVAIESIRRSTPPTR